VELIILCEACGQPVEDGEGGLGIDSNAADDVLQAVREWEATRTAGQDGQALPTDGFCDLLDYPARVRWYSHHAACDQVLPGGAYVIGAEQLRTWADLAAWTEQLMGKSWLAGTDWQQVLGETARHEGKRVQAAVKPRLSF
jgi:hypothetical protein